ncbi:unnamed protein product [Lampetra fluviatilis]
MPPKHDPRTRGATARGEEPESGSPLSRERGEKQQRLSHEEIISAPLLQTNAVAYYVNMMATVYVDVSNKYLMNTVSGLGRLIALDDSNERQGELKKLTEYCKEAQKGIIETANLKKNEYDEKFRERQQSIEY